MEKSATEEQEDLDNKLGEEVIKEDTNRKSLGEILKQQIEEGQETYDKKPGSIVVSSITAGLEVGFSYLLLCTLHGFLQGKCSEETIFKLMSFVYPIGFIMVILGQSILFTEQTSLLTLPVLNKKRQFSSLIKLWSLVIFGNLVGGWIISFIIVWIGPELHIFDLETVEKIAVHVTDYPALTIFASAILAGWLMGLLSWLIAASKDTLSRIVIVFMITTILAFIGLHHSIVGNIEVFSGLISSTKIGWSDYLSFQGIALLGNAIGGAFFVALLKYRAFVHDVR